MRSRLAIFLLTSSLVLTGCTGSAEPSATPAQGGPSSRSAVPSASPSASRSAGPSASPESGEVAAPDDATPNQSASPTPASVNRVSLPALMNKKYDGRTLRLGEEIVRTDAYTQRFVTYRSGSLQISGIMNIPDGEGPFPVLVLAHGYIDPAIYANGQGLRREQDWLARAGYVVLHTDYRDHASSDTGRRTELKMRLGYTEDVINAVHAIRASRLRFLDKERVGLLGRSMGGGVAYNVLVSAPGLVDAAVVYAPVSSNTVDNFDRWIRGDPDRDGLDQRIIRAYGSPKKNPAFWRGVSPRSFFDRITEPVLIHHGTDDESCPIRWSRKSHALLRRAGVDADLVVHPGEPHAFINAWPRSMRRTVRFFDRNLDVA